MEWSNRHFRTSRNQDICWPTMVGSLLKILFEILYTLHFGDGITVTFLRKEKKGKGI